MIRKIKKILAGIGIILGIFLLMRGRFAFINYKDVKIPVFRFLSGKDEYFFEWVLGKYTLQTEYGEITIKPFCNIVSTYYNSLESISWSQFKQKRAFHNLKFLDNPFDPIIIISFSPENNYKIDAITIPFKLQVFTLGLYSFRTNRIYFWEEKGDINEIIIYFLSDKRKISLNDMTDIEFNTIFDEKKEYYDFLPYTLRILKNNEWQIYAEYVKLDYLTVKCPGWPEARKCDAIRFESGWGNYIESREYVEEPTKIILGRP